MIIMKVIVIILKLTSRLTVVPLAPWLCTAATAVGRNVNIIIIIIIVIILITTRPKSAYSRQGLAKISLRVSGAQLGSDVFS